MPDGLPLAPLLFGVVPALVELLFQLVMLLLPAQSPQLLLRTHAARTLAEGALRWWAGGSDELAPWLRRQRASGPPASWEHGRGKLTHLRLSGEVRDGHRAGTRRSQRLPANNRS